MLIIYIIIISMPLFELFIHKVYIAEHMVIIGFWVLCRVFLYYSLICRSAYIYYICVFIANHSMYIVTSLGHCSF
jgi:hypothetical protein